MTANTILVVESEILVRQPLAQYLRDCGYSVIETASGEEARQAFSNGKLRIDVALIDVHSPTESGFALSAWIRSHFPDVELMLAGTVAKALQSAGDLATRARLPANLQTTNRSWITSGGCWRTEKLRLQRTSRTQFSACKASTQSLERRPTSPIRPLNLLFLDW
jgi:CheY-like chemotaxis protein